MVTLTYGEVLITGIVAGVAWGLAFLLGYFVGGQREHDHRG